MGEAQGRIRLKGLFAFGLLVLALGYVVPTVGVAAGPSVPVAATLSARLDASDLTGRPRPLILRQDARVFEGRQVIFSELLRTVQAPVPYATRQVPDAGLPAGATVVIVPGAAGSLTKVFEDDLVDGDTVTSTQLSESLTQPSDRVVRVGTGAPPPPAIDLSGAPPAYAQAIAGSSTAYCDQGHTATGTQAGPGSIAVDPRVIPLGSHLFIPGYGYGWAVDTGGAVIGTIVDVWMASCADAIQWGRRTLTIYVLAS